MATDSKVTEFLEQNAPPELVEGLEILAKLDVPIHDLDSFQRQLDDVAAGDDSSPAVETLTERFDPGDLPIMSLQNAFEKYWDAFQPGPFLDVPDRYGPPRTSGKPICEIYEETFEVPGAAECACRAYAEARRAGHSDYEAQLMGFGAGKTVEDTGDCPVPGVETSPYEWRGPVWGGGSP